MTPEQAQNERELTQQAKIYLEQIEGLSKRNLDLFHDKMDLEAEIKELVEAIERAMEERILCHPKVEAAAMENLEVIIAKHRDREKQ